MGEPSLPITATTVRVPVFICHAESVNIETEQKLSANEARALLSAAPGIQVYDDPAITCIRARSTWWVQMRCMSGG